MSDKLVEDVIKLKTKMMNTRDTLNQLLPWMEKAFPALEVRVVSLEEEEELWAGTFARLEGRVESLESLPTVIAAPLDSPVVPAVQVHDGGAKKSKKKSKKRKSTKRTKRRKS